MTITYIIIGFTVLISFYAFNRPAVLQKLIMNPYSVTHRKEYYRLLTSGFIHKDHMHLLFNMFSLYFFGAAIENAFKAIFAGAGNIAFIILYVMAIVVSEIPTLIKNKDNPHYNSLGASGGVAAVIFASILLMPMNKICLYFAICMPGFILGTLYLAFSYYQGRKANDGINHDAHLYGALFGLIFCAVLYPRSIPDFVEQVKQWHPFN
ncbi:MAG: rhomboid family intramembrane serine protease [Chryseolinea sp.]